MALLQGRHANIQNEDRKMYEIDKQAVQVAEKSGQPKKEKCGRPKSVKAKNEENVADQKRCRGHLDQRPKCDTWGPKGQQTMTQEPRKTQGDNWTEQWLRPVENQKSMKWQTKKGGVSVVNGTGLKKGPKCETQDSRLWKRQKP